MRDFKFDIDIILKNCERFGVKVESGNNAGVTMNGEAFDVTEEMQKAFEELTNTPNTSRKTDALLTRTISCGDSKDNQPTVKKERAMMSEYTKAKTALIAA